MSARWIVTTSDGREEAWLGDVCFGAVQIAKGKRGYHFVWARFIGVRVTTWTRRPTRAAAKLALDNDIAMWLEKCGLTVREPRA